MENLNTIILSLIENKKIFAIATIVSHSGSTPRTSGTKMVILPDGTIEGTIGGGLIEAKVIEESVKLISLKLNSFKSYHLNSTLKDSIDMVCGGSLSVLIETITQENSVTDLFVGMIRESEQGQKCLKITELPKSEEKPDRIKRCLVKSSREVMGENIIPDSFNGDFLKSYFKMNTPVVTEIGDRRLIIEPAFTKGTVYLFGAGHVSQKVAEITHLLDFKTVIIDDREEFANRERFPKANKILVIHDFRKSLETFSMDSDSYLVILTRGHLHDQTVLEEALKTEAGYIGMIGSRRKQKQVYEHLHHKGFTKEDFKRVKSPIGIEIKAETPAEIAVSITAEIIATKNSNR